MWFTALEQLRKGVLLNVSLVKVTEEFKGRLGWKTTGTYLGCNLQSLSAFVLQASAC